MATTYLGQIVDHQVWIIPCQKLTKFIKSIKIADNLDKIPLGIQETVYSICPATKLKSIDSSKTEYLLTEDDRKFIKSLKSQFIDKSTKETLQKPTYIHDSNNITIENRLDIQDLRWLYEYIQKQNTSSNTKIYLHELMEGSIIILPKNKTISRNKELDKRCKILEAEQQNKQYQMMTKSLNSLRKGHEDDTICSQLKMMNKHLIAVFQYIISILTGFTFGFYGIEMITTPLDLGFRLLLGIICGLAVALAELYFLAKALNMDLDDDPQIFKQKTLKLS